jgi:predicted Fe-Mo cluster-binding NifX family protein
MKILLATDGNSLDSNISKRFGEAPYYLIYDTETQHVEPRVNHGHDDGHTELIKLIEEGILHYIVGNTGPNAFDVLTKRGAKLYLGRGMSARNALITYQNNNLEQLKKPTLKRPIKKHNH